MPTHVSAACVARQRFHQTREHVEFGVQPDVKRTTPIGSEYEPGQGLLTVNLMQKPERIVGVRLQTTDDTRALQNGVPSSEEGVSHLKRHVLETGSTEVFERDVNIHGRLKSQPPRN
jgi:hypothetical protein